MKIPDFNNRKYLMNRYEFLVEEAYNLRFTDSALSDYDYHEALKIRRRLELQFRLQFKTSINDLLE